MALPYPVIVVPGIIATYLRDRYPIPPETIWSVLKTDYERAALHPDDLTTKVEAKKRTFEAVEPAQVVADQVYEIAYRELVEELRFNLRDREDQPVPVYAFGYDWRQPLEAIQEEFAAFVAEVIGRTSLMRHYYRARYAENPKVNLVGHSMGGLIIAGALARFGKALKVDRVVTLGTPFQGSFEAVVKVATGTANLGGDVPSSREREAARMTPALYHLMPSFKAGVTIDPSLPQTSLFDPALWQGSIADTIAEYIRLRGRETTNPAERRAMAAKVLAAMLAAAQDHRRTVDRLKLDDAGLTPGQWLCVVGVNSETRIRLEVGKGPAFVFKRDDKANEWFQSGAAARRTGDGTVPFEGAIPPFLPYESLVCVRPDDFDTFEVGDKITLRLAGFHGMLGNMNMLQRMIVRFFTDAGDPHRATWGLPPPGVTKEAWKPPLPLDQPR